MTPKENILVGLVFICPFLVFKDMPLQSNFRMGRGGKRGYWWGIARCDVSIPFVGDHNVSVVLLSQPGKSEVLAGFYTP